MMLDSKDKGDHVLAGWFTNALPGFRELRPTFASGILWSFFLLVAGHETIAGAEDATGLAGDIHMIAERSDPLLVAVVLGTLVFAIGAVTFSAVEWLARQLGTATESLARIRDWKAHSDRMISQLSSQVATNQLGVTRLDESPKQDTEAKRKIASRQRASHLAAIGSAQRRLDKVQYRFAFGALHN